MTGREHGQLDQLEHLRRATNVGRGVGAEDLRQRLAVLEQLARAELVLGLAQEVLLARGADKVGVLVAEAHVGERVVVAELLVSRLQVDLRVRLAGSGVVVEVAPVHVRVDAAHAVDGVPEAAEVHVDHVVDAARNAQNALDRAGREAGPPHVVGRVDLGRPHRAAVVDRHPEIARDRHDRCRGLVRIEADQHHRVGVPADALAVDRPVVGAQQHDRLGGADVGTRERVSAEVQVRALVERVGDVLHLEQRGGRRGGGAQPDDEQERDAEALPHVAGEARDLGIHQPGSSSTALSAGPSPASEAGSRRTNSPSACR